MTNIKEKIRQGWIHASLMIEVVGKPAEHIEQALSLAIDKLAKERDFELIEKKMHKAKPVKESKTLFSTFVEIEFLVDKFSRLVDIIFDYMPSSVEIIDPPDLNLKLDYANSFLNDLAMKLHQYDAALKTLKLQLSILAKKFEEMEKGMKKG